jgi:CubicO group peptidase (beta-lactamase class C family)
MIKEFPMTRPLCISVLGVLLLWLTSAAATSAKLDSIILKTIAQNQSIPNSAFSVGVMYKGQVVHSKGYGLRDRELGLPVTPETRFYIGSNTKSFTVLGLAMLRDEGIFNFDTLVTTYLPDFRTIDTSINAKITPADMLSHRTGLPRHDALWTFTNLGRDEIVRRIRYLEMDYRNGVGFRNSYQYNNLMYMAAGTITEKLKTTTWEKFTQDRILTPLNMTNSGFGRSGFIDYANSARPYDSSGTLLAFPLEKGEAVGPAGTIYSTAEDMLKYLNLYLLLGKTPAGQTLISQAGITQIFTARNDPRDGQHLITNAVLSYYGMGWRVDWDSTNWVGYHGGELGGYTSQMAFDQANQIAVVVLASQKNAPAINPIINAMLDYLHGKPAALSAPQAPAMADLDPAAGPSSVGISKGLKKSSAYQVVKRFTHPGYGEMDLVTDGTQFYYNWFDNYWQIYKKEGIYDYYWRTYPASGIASVPSYLERDSSGDTVALYPVLEPYAISRFAATGDASVPPLQPAGKRSGDRDARIVIRNGTGGVQFSIRSPDAPWHLVITDLRGSVVQTIRGLRTSRHACPEPVVLRKITRGAYLYRCTDDTGDNSAGKFIVLQ